MPRFRAPRGTRDILPRERIVWQRLEGLASELSQRYGYPSIETPLIEDIDLFERGIGRVTDIVEKELFRVGPASGEGDRWALRPEGTAGIVRAYLEHGLHTAPRPVRFSLLGPMFRYDRPQAGRYRQFWQWDVEAIGDAGPGVDAEIIELGYRFYRDAGLTDVEVHLNSIGDAECRPRYVARLEEHFRAHEEGLSDIERSRLAANPLRLLDSKDPSMATLIADAPRVVDHLCEACRHHFEGLQRLLASIDVPVRLQPALVRGLDYYTRTAFEYYVPEATGSQAALGGGGRYDGLVELLGGKPTPAVGFALGLDRVVLALDRVSGSATQVDRPLAFVVSADPADVAGRLRVVTQLRDAGIAARADLALRKLGRQLESAAREGAHFAVILGDELRSGQVLLKDLEAGTQRPANVADLARELQRAGESHRHGP